MNAKLLADEVYLCIIVLHDVIWTMYPVIQRVFHSQQRQQTALKISSTSTDPAVAIRSEFLAVRFVLGVRQ